MNIGDLIVFLSADGSQIEVRFLAEVSGDPTLIGQFNTGQDIHCLIGNTLTGYSVERIRTEKGLRKMIKGLVFAIIYGKGRDNLYASVVAGIRKIEGPDADLTGIVESKLVKMYDAFFKKYAGVRRYIDDSRNMVEEIGCVETIYGFKREILKDSETRHTYWGNQAINCVDYETQILTKRGWVSGRDLTTGDYCLTEHGWKHPIEINQFPKYMGPVHVWKSRDFSAVSTPDHRWKVYNRHRRKDEIWTSGALPKYSDFKVYRTFDHDFNNGREVYSDDFVRLCGWFLTDGTISDANRTGIMIIQSKPSTKNDIQIIMNHLDVDTGYVTKAGAHVWYVGGKLGKQIRETLPNRVLTSPFISSLSQRQAKILIRTMLDGDGDGTTSRERLVCGEPRKFGMASAVDKADMFQMLCAWAGFASSVKKRSNIKSVVYKKTGQTITPKFPIYLITVLRRKKTQVCQQHETIAQGNGVWCPTFTNDSLWVARREGTTYVTKNSPIQGSAHQYLLIAMALLHIKPVTYSLLQTSVLEIHDQLVFFVKLRNLVSAYTQLMQLIQEGCVAYTLRHFKRQIRVPMLAEAQASFNLGSLIDYAGEPVEEFLKKWRVKQREVESKSWKDT